MDIKFYNSINLQGINVRNYIQNPMSQSQIDDTTGSLSGSSYGYSVYNTTLNLPGWWNGEQFVYLTDSSSINISNLATTGSNIFNGNQIISGNVEISGSFIGNLIGTALSSSYSPIQSTLTSSVILTASVNLNTIEFTKGNGDTFSIIINTGSIDLTNYITSSQTGSFISSGSNISQLKNDENYLKNLIEDSTPQLSGNLDSREQNIENVGNIQIVSHSYSREFDNGNIGVSGTVNFQNSNFHKITLNTNYTSSFTDPSGPTTCILKVVQDTTGSRLIEWESKIKWTNDTPPQLSTATGSEDIISFYFDGTNYYGGYLIGY